MSPLFFSFVAAGVIGLISLIGIVFIIFRLPTVSRFSHYLVAFAIGSLIGDAFIHLLPSAFTGISSPLPVSLLSLAGLILFYIIEEILHWHHCHDPDCHQPESASIVTLNLAGDSVHNLVDGMLIAASFNTNFGLGLTTSLAVLFHEIPQEIGDFGIFIHQGLGFSRAIKLNFLSALFALLGVLLVHLIGFRSQSFSTYLLPVTAGGFIYLALSDLIPQLHHRSRRPLQSLIYLSAIILGIALMVILDFVE